MRSITLSVLIAVIGVVLPTAASAHYAGPSTGVAARTPYLLAVEVTKCVKCFGIPGLDPIACTKPRVIHCPVRAAVDAIRDRREERRNRKR